MFSFHKSAFTLHSYCFSFSSSFFILSPYALSYPFSSSSSFCLASSYHSKNFFSDLKGIPPFQEKESFSNNIIDIRMKSAIYNLATKKLEKEFDENTFVSNCYKVLNFKNYNEKEYEEKIEEFIFILKGNIERIQNLITVVTLLNYFKSIKAYKNIDKLNLSLQLIVSRAFNILEKNYILNDDGNLLYSFTCYLVENEEKLSIPQDQKECLVKYILKHSRLFGFEIFYKTLRSLSKSAFYYQALSPKINKILKIALKDHKFLIESTFLEIFNIANNLLISSSHLKKRRLMKLFKIFEERKYETRAETQTFLITLKQNCEIK